MEVPRLWRDRKHLLNPNANGYRPKSPYDEMQSSAKITCIEYDGTPDSYARREVQRYSEMIKDNTNTVQVEVSSGVIYQDTGVAI